MQTYIDAVESCLEQCREMLRLESEKRRVLLTNSGKEIEAVLKNQQAALMKLEVLEKQRMTAQVAQGYDEKATASQILQMMPDGEEKQQLQQLVDQLRECAAELKKQNQSSLELARLDLQLIESLRGKQQQPVAQSGVYSRTQASKPMQPNKFNSSV